MHFQLRGDLALTERKRWQEQETNRQVLLLALRSQQPKRGYVLAWVGSWLVACGQWMQGRPEVAA